MQSDQQEIIEFADLLVVLWTKKKFIIVVSSVFVIFGLFFALFSPVEYKSTTKLVIESQSEYSSSLKGLGSLSGLAGIDLGFDESKTYSPDLYPEIIQSIPFLIKLYQKPLHFETIDTLVSSEKYLTGIRKESGLEIISKYTIRLPGRLIKLFKSSNRHGVISELEADQSDYIKLNKEKLEELDGFSDRLSVNIDDDTGLVYISTTFPDPVASADLTSSLYKNLSNEIINYQTEKTKKELDFIRNQYLGAKKNYEHKQILLANYKDSNINIKSAVYDSRVDHLTNEYHLAYDLYKGLANQLEQAKIAVEKQTPVFSVIDPVIVPVKKHSPKRLFILVVWTISGVLLSFILIFLSNVLNPLRVEILKRFGI